jgi:hypothetical protein
MDFFNEFKSWFFDGIGFSNRIKIMNPAGYETRLESSIARMGLNESQLRKGKDWGPNDCVQYYYKELRNKIAGSSK